MEEELIHLFQAIKNNSTINEAQPRLIELLNTPDVFEAFFSILRDEKGLIQNKKDASVFLKVAIRDQFFINVQGEFNEELMNFVKSQILEILFQIRDQYIIEVLVGSIEMIVTNSQNKIDSWPDLLPAAIEAIQDPATINSSIAVLSSCIPFIPQQSIVESLEQFVQIIDVGINFDQWPVRAEAFEILQKITPYIIEAGGDISSQVSVFLTYPQTPANLANNYLFRIWVVIQVLASKGYISEEQILAIHPIVMQIATNTSVDANTRLLIMHFVLSILPGLNEEQLGQIFDLNFEFASAIVNESKSVEPLLFQIIEQALTDLDLESVYGMLKERIMHSFESENVNLQAFSVYALSSILLYGPEAARDEIEFVDDILNHAIESNNTLLQQAACYTLDCLDETFPGAQILCSSYIMKIVPFLQSTDTNLKTLAFSALHCLCQLLDGEVEGFFQACWELHESLSNESDFDSFASLFADALSRTEISDEDMAAVIEYVSPYFAEDVDDAAPVLLIVSSIINCDEGQAESLLPPAMDLCNRALYSTNDQTKINAIDFIQAIIQNYSQVIVENYKPVLHRIKRIAKSILEADETTTQQEHVANEEEEAEEEEQLEPPSDTEQADGENANEEEEDDDEDDSRETVYVAAIQTMASVAKQLKHKRYAKEIQECILYALTLDETITSMYDAASNIAKLLYRRDAKQLFLNLHDIIIDEKNPHTVSDALQPYTKLVKHACNRNKELFVSKSYEVLEAFFDGNLPSLGGVKPLEGRSDYVLMTNIAYLLTEIVRIPNREGVDQLCQCMLQILQVEGHMAAYSFLAAYSDAISYDTCSPEMTAALFEIIPSLVESTQEPDLQQNICFLLNILVKKNQGMLEDIMGFFPTVWEWFSTGLQQDNGYQGLVSNAASLFMTLAVLNPAFPDEAIEAAFTQYPPYDTSETKPMTDMILRFFNERSQFNGELLAVAVVSICNLLVMPENEILENKVTPEQITGLQQLLRQIASMGEGITQIIANQFEKNSTKLEKISQILQPASN